MTCDIPVIVNCAKSRLLCAQAQTKHVFHSFTSTSRHKRGCDGLRWSVVGSVEIKLLALNDSNLHQHQNLWRNFENKGISIGQ